MGCVAELKLQNVINKNNIGSYTNNVLNNAQDTLDDLRDKIKLEIKTKENGENENEGTYKSKGITFRTCGDFFEARRGNVCTRNGYKRKRGYGKVCAHTGCHLETCCIKRKHQKVIVAGKNTCGAFFDRHLPGICGLNSKKDRAVVCEFCSQRECCEDTKRETCGEWDEKTSGACVTNGMVLANSARLCRAGEDGCDEIQCCVQYKDKKENCDEFYYREGSNVCAHTGFLSKVFSVESIECVSSECLSSECCKGEETCESFLHINGRRICEQNGYTGPKPNYDALQCTGNPRICSLERCCQP